MLYTTDSPEVMTQKIINQCKEEDPEVKLRLFLMPRVKNIVYYGIPKI